MRLENTTTGQDEILSKCEDFGGLAKGCADICAELDRELEKAKDKLSEYENRIMELEGEIEDLKSES